MDELTSKRCRALLESAKADEPGSDALQRTAAAIGISTAMVAGSIAASKTAGVGTAGVIAATKNTSGALSGMAGGSASLATKVVSVVLVLAGGAVGVVQWTKQTSELPSSANARGTSDTRPDVRDRAASLPPAQLRVPAAELPGDSGAESELPVRMNSGGRGGGTASFSAKVRAPKRDSVRARAPNGPNALEREMALLAEARTALNASDPDRCLRWLNEYRRLFSAGVLEREARVLRERAEEQVRSKP